jgi:hypothetical protein
MTPRLNSSARPDRIAAQHYRDAAFRRIVRVRGASVIGAGALTAVVAGVVSAVAPGHTLGAKARTPVAQAGPTQPAASSAASNKLPPLAQPSQLGLQGPGSAPQSAPAPSQPAAPAASQPSAPAPSGPVVSGGS